MIHHYILPKSLWRETHKTVTYIFNRIPIKITTKILYEFWIEKKFNLKHLHI